MCVCVKCVGIGRQLLEYGKSENVPCELVSEARSSCLPLTCVFSTGFWIIIFLPCFHWLICIDHCQSVHSNLQPHPTPPVLWLVRPNLHSPPLRTEWSSGITNVLDLFQRCSGYLITSTTLSQGKSFMGGMHLWRKKKGDVYSESSLSLNFWPTEWDWIAPNWFYSSEDNQDKINNNDYWHPDKVNSRSIWTTLHVWTMSCDNAWFVYCFI